MASNLSVSHKGPLSSIGLVTFVFVCLTVALSSFATPIHPTAKQILKDARPAGQEFIPARAGWNGPENRKTSSANPLMERFRPAAQARANRESFLAMVTPDVRLWGFLAWLIFSFRMLHLRAERRAAPPVLIKQPPAEQPPSHLQAA